MPIKKENYPPNWPDISKSIRAQRNYTCELCWKGTIHKNPFTVHHLDHDPMCSTNSNLALLHAICHLLFHSTFKYVRTRQQFNQVVKNYHNQQTFKFIRKEKLNEPTKVLQS